MVCDPESLISTYRPLALKLSWEMREPCIDQDDLNSAAFCGLVKGVRDYNPHRGAKEITCIYHHIRWAILREKETQRRKLWPAMQTNRVLTLEVEQTIGDPHLPDPLHLVFCQDVWRWGQELPPPLPEILRLYYVDEAPLEEIGGRMGCSREWIRRQLRKAHDALRKQITL